MQYIVILFLKDAPRAGPLESGKGRNEFHAPERNYGKSAQENMLMIPGRTTRTKSFQKKNGRTSGSRISPASPLKDLSAATLPSIAIVGRPNVGKSSLFNAILKRRHAIVHFDSGVTRDRVSAVAAHDDHRFHLLDTGGLGLYQGEKKSAGFWDEAIEKQADAAINSADVILFVVDALHGIHPLDMEIAARLRASGKKILLAANKSDNPEIELTSAEFHKLGFNTLFPVSSLHRRGISALLDAAVTAFPAPGKESHREPAEKPLRIAVLGRPNVGKSSIVNRLLGEERVIVSDIPGTTRDSVDACFMLRCDGKDVPALIVDTAGLRKRSKVEEAVERYSMMRAAETLETCDIVLFVIESGAGEATSQDKTIASMIEKSGRACIIVANKWDIRDGLEKEQPLLENIRASLPKMAYAPIVFISAKTGYHFFELAHTIGLLRNGMGVKISTAALNRVIQDTVTRNPPPAAGKKPLKIYYGTLTGTTPPEITLFVNQASLCPETYKTYLTNTFRRAFPFTGFPLVLRFRARERRDLSDMVHHSGTLAKKHVANARQYKQKKAKVAAVRKAKKKKNSTRSARKN